LETQPKRAHSRWCSRIARLVNPSSAIKTTRNVGRFASTQSQKQYRGTTALPIRARAVSAATTPNALPHHGQRNEDDGGDDRPQHFRAVRPISLTPRFREANCGTSIPLEVELELAAHGRIEAVEKLAELWACDVILHISGVEVVSGVKNGHADSRSPSSNPGDDLW